MCNADAGAQTGQIIVERSIKRCIAFHAEDDVAALPIISQMKPANDAVAIAALAADLAARAAIAAISAQSPLWIGYVGWEIV